MLERLKIGRLSLWLFSLINCMLLRLSLMGRLLWFGFTLLCMVSKWQLTSYYGVLRGRNECSSRFPWKCIWKTRVSFRVAFFTSSVALGKIFLTTDNLRKRAILIIDWYCMYKYNGESVDHLLLHCPFARELYGILFCLVGLSWVGPQSILALLDSWRGAEFEILLFEMFVWLFTSYFFFSYGWFSGLCWSTVSQ